MKFNLLFLISLMLFFTTNSNAQINDSIRTRELALNGIVPVAFIGAGLLISNSDYEVKFQTKVRDKVGNDFHSSIDNYTMYMPIAEMYIADFVGVKSRNHWFDQTKNLFISNFVTLLITRGIKYTVYKTRPDGSENNSFPSGHSSFSFTNASVLFYEFKDTSPLLAYSGYAFATTTSAFRVMNNEHWLSDVLVGAGIGMAVTSLVYYFEPFKNFNPFINLDKFTLVPIVDEDNYGAYFSYSF